MHFLEKRWVCKGNLILGYIWYLACSLMSIKELEQGM